jgi:hypothetical protein
MNFLDQHPQVDSLASAINALVTIANGLVRTVVGETQEFEDGVVNPDLEIQVCVNKNVGEHGGIVIFAPRAKSERYELVCPNVLRKNEAGTKYPKKGWIIQRTDNGMPEVTNDGAAGSIPTYRLVCKTPIFMPLGFKPGDKEGGDDPLSIYTPQRVLVTGE